MGVSAVATTLTAGTAIAADAAYWSIATLCALAALVTFGYIIYVVGPSKVFGLERMNIPTKFCKAISSLYNDPQFRVKMGNEESNWKTQTTGIRQGCPLSPYLFIILMTVLFRDVRDGLNIGNQAVEGMDFHELLYADDTALITTTAPSMNKLVSKIDTCAEHFGLKFNYTKCVAINYNTPYSTKFKNGDKIPSGMETVYLGATIRKDHNVRREISKRIGTCFATLTRLDLFWNNK